MFPHQYVIVLDPEKCIGAGTEEKILERFKRLGRVEPIESGKNHYVLSFPQKEHEGGKMEKTWSDLQKRAGNAAQILPVIIDRDGVHRFPSGSIVTRFEENKSDEEIAEWGAQRGLKMKARNRYIPQQVSFIPAAPSESNFLKMLQDIEAKCGSETVWPELFSRPQREK